MPGTLASGARMVSAHRRPRLRKSATVAGPSAVVLNPQVHKHLPKAMNILSFLAVSPLDPPRRSVGTPPALPRVPLPILYMNEITALSSASASAPAPRRVNTHTFTSSTSSAPPHVHNWPSRQRGRVASRDGTQKKEERRKRQRMPPDSSCNTS